MATSIGVRYSCDRCGKRWFKEVDTSQVPPTTPAARGSFSPAPGTPCAFSYHTLCPSCAKVIERAFVTMAPVTRTRGKKHEEDEAAGTELEELDPDELVEV